MNGEYEQCNNCKHIWEHEDDACPECGSQNTWEFDIVTEFKALQKQISRPEGAQAELKELALEAIKHAPTKFEEAYIIRLNKHSAQRSDK